MSSKILIGHPTGNQFFLNTIEAFHKKHQIHEIWTCLGFPQNGILDKLSKLPGFGELSRRRVDGKFKEYLRSRPQVEIARLLFQKVGFRKAVSDESFLFSIDQVYRDFDMQISKTIKKTHQRPSHVYLYEDGALETFRFAKENGIKTIYDLPIAYWKESENLLKQEALRYPQWEPTLIGNKMSSAKKNRKDEELELADCIICPSDFVKTSLTSHTQYSPKTVVIPFGNPNISIQENSNNSNNDGPLKLVFAGTMTQRKGLADLFEAMKLLNSNRVELHIIGSPMMDYSFYRKEFDGFTYHPTRSHPELLELLKQFDAFVLPSIIEGRAQTQLEALACGLPIIVTKNAGAEDMVIEGETGYLVPVGSPEQIAEKIELLANDRSKLNQMKRNAFEKAKSWSWENYQNLLVETVNSVE